MFRFRDRTGILDDRSLRFLKTVAWLGGYVTAEQAQELGVRNSLPRVHVHLNDLESWRFVKRIATYPVVYQVTKSVTRLVGADLFARRQHALENIQTRLLTVNFYLEAVRWPVEFIFDHERKLSTFRSFACDGDLLPQRGGKPYLWQDLLLQRPSGDLVVAMVDHTGRDPYLQLYRLLQRFAPSLRLIQDEMKLAVVVGSEHRLKPFSRLLRRPRLQRLVADVPNGLLGAVQLYRVQRPVPAVRSLVPRGREVPEFPASHFTAVQRVGRIQIRSETRQANRADVNHPEEDSWIEEGGE